MICFDPGHGGKDPGAVSSGLKESDLNLLIARRAKEPLVWGKIPVCWTRTFENHFIPIMDRPKIAIHNKADLFVSFHCNAASNMNARGVEILVVKGDLKSRDIASQVLKHWTQLESRLVLRNTPIVERPISGRGSLGVLRGCVNAGIPAILVEAGFITNPLDRKLLMDIHYSQNLGIALSRIK